jgi:hypothetical protein
MVALEARNYSFNSPSLVERCASLAFNYTLKHCQVFRYIMLLPNWIPLADLLAQAAIQQKGQRSDTILAE